MGDGASRPVHEPVGPLALVGGGEWRDGCSFDAELIEATAADEVAVLPTAAAYEQPGRVIEAARAWFQTLGVRVRPVMVLARPDASDAAMVSAVRGARFVYLTGGSPLHLRSVLKESPVWQALLETWREGASVAGASAGAMVLGDPMVDPRGGAFTLGLGMIENLAVLPEASAWSPERLRRTIHLAPATVALVTVDPSSAVVRSPTGGWRAAGTGDVHVYRGGSEVGLDALGA